jgi:hypothetical protein
MLLPPCRDTKIFHEAQGTIIIVSGFQHMRI